MIMMDSSTYTLNPIEQHTILKNATDNQTAAMRTTTADLADTTLLNTNHNSNYFHNQSFNSPIPSRNNMLSANLQAFAENLEARGANALHRRAEQLRRWREAEEEFESRNRLGRNHINLINSSTLIFRRRNDNRKIMFYNATLFLAACASSDYDEINRILNDNLVDINVGNVDGLTALHHSCIDDNLELVEFLLKKGADVNCVDNEGWSPLHATASCDHLNIARMLLDYGADSTIVNVDHELALDLAEDKTMRELLENALYLQTGTRDFDKFRRQEEDKMRADVLDMIRTGIYDNKTHKRTGATIIHVAACKGYFEVLQLLFSNKTLKDQIDVNVRDNEGWTPLAAAVYWNKSMIVELLLQNGADVNCVTNNKQTLEQLTDYDLILNLIANRREQLKKQEILRLQEENNKENGNINKSNANVGNMESETQRRAHAKRIRESRRSTQGISAEDVIKAKDQISMNSTVINVNSSDKQESKQLSESNKVEITKLETINEISNPISNEESNSIQSLPPSLQRTSKSDSCEIVEVKSVLDSVDGQRSKIREFARAYRPKITVDENDDNIDQELNATINLNLNSNSDEILNNNDKDELKNDVVLNLRRDSLNILHQRTSKDTKKSAALNHSTKENTNNQVRVERFDDHQLPKLSTNLTNCNLENQEFTVKRDISQDSLDEQNGNDYIGINSTLNCTVNNGLNDNRILIEQKCEPQQSNVQNNYLNKQLLNKQQSVDKQTADRNLINDNLRNYPPESNNADHLLNSYLSTRPNHQAHLQQANVRFEVPVLIETPCTPEPVEEESNSESISENVKPKSGNNFDIDSENNLTKRKKTKRRIDNQEEIDALFNETVNVINPKYTRSQLTNTYNDLDQNYAYKNNSVNNSTCKSNGNALKLYKKVDEDSSSKVSSLIKIVNPVYKLFRKVINSAAWNQLDKIRDSASKQSDHHSKINGDLPIDKL